MLSDEFPDLGIRGPKTIGGTPVTMSLYIEDVDDVYTRAVDAGAIALRPVTDQFYGDRTGQFEDPFGHRWSVATRIEAFPLNRWPSAPPRRTPDAATGNSAGGRYRVVSARTLQHEPSGA